MRMHSSTSYSSMLTSCLICDMLKTVGSLQLPSISTGANMASSSFLQVSPNISRYFQVSPNISRYPWLSQEPAGAPVVSLSPARVRSLLKYQADQRRCRSRVTKTGFPASSLNRFWPVHDPSLTPSLVANPRVPGEQLGVMGGHAERIENSAAGTQGTIGCWTI